MIPSISRVQLPALPPEDGAVGEALADVDTRLAAWSHAVSAAEAAMGRRAELQVDQARRLIGYADQLRNALHHLRPGVADGTAPGDDPTPGVEYESGGA